ncbi:MAG: iron-containing alcohol dehydrogenase [Smithella sp.]
MPRVLPNPSIDNVEEAYAQYLKNGCDAVIGFGGSSPMDCAKVVAGRVARPHLPADQLGGYFKIMFPIPKKLPRILCRTDNVRNRCGDHQRSGDYRFPEKHQVHGE